MAISSLWATGGNPSATGLKASSSAGVDESLFASIMKKASESELQNGTPLTPETSAPQESARLNQQGNLALSVSRDSAQPVDLGTLRSDAELALGQWQQQLLGKLSEQGISLDEPLRLLVRPGDGKIVVQGDHPRKADIEAILNDDPALAHSIRGVSSLFDLLRAADQHEQFAAAYEADPVAAVQTFSHLFDEQTAWPLEFRIDEYGGEVVGD